MPVITPPSRLAALLAEPLARRPLDVASPVVVYGAGATGREVVRALRALGHQVVSVIDRRGGTGLRVDDLAVHLPGTEPLDRPARAAATAVVGVFNRDAEVDAIHRLLCGAGYGRVIGMVELHDLLGGPDRYWLGARDVAQRAAGDVLAVADVWEDATSRQLYDDIVAYRLTGDTGLAPRPHPGVQYFPADVPRGSAPMQYVDCGAYDGDTLEAALAAGKVSSYHAFEPDPRNFASLSVRARELASHCAVRLWPCAVDATTSMRHFSSGAGEASALSEQGDATVQCVALDDAIAAGHVTDIKMDIEGAELDALMGARRLVQRSRPRLALCVYHRPDHLWSIPLAVRELGLDYAYFLRAHAHAGFDVVLYAVPREQLATDDASPLRISP